MTIPPIQCEKKKFTILKKSEKRKFSIDAYRPIAILPIGSGFFVFVFVHVYRVIFIAISFRFVSFQFAQKNTIFFMYIQILTELNGNGI